MLKKKKHKDFFIYFRERGRERAWGEAEGERILGGLLDERGARRGAC